MEFAKQFKSKARCIIALSVAMIMLTGSVVYAGNYGYECNGIAEVSAHDYIPYESDGNFYSSRDSYEESSNNEIYESGSNTENEHDGDLEAAEPEEEYSGYELSEPEEEYGEYKLSEPEEEYGEYELSEPEEEYGEYELEEPYENECGYCDDDCICEYIVGYIRIMPLSVMDVGSMMELASAIDSTPDNFSREIILTSDIILTESLSINRGIDISINGNGHRISHGGSASRHFVVNNGTLRLRDVTLDNASSAQNRGGVHVSHADGHFIMETGTVVTGVNSNSGHPLGLNPSALNASGGVRISYGRFTMNGGEIRGNSNNHIHAYTGAGVFNNGIFVMNGGTISGNSGHNGGGISLATNARTTLNSGTISGNTATGQTGASGLTGGGGGLSLAPTASLNNLTIAPDVVFENNTAGSGIRISDLLNLNHNINANGRINPGSWSGGHDVPHVFNNYDIRVGQERILNIVTFNLHGGTVTIGENNFQAQGVPNNGTVTVPIGHLSRTGYRFEGWYTAATGGTAFDFSTPITTDTVIHARWESWVSIGAANRTVTFNLHGGTGNFPAQTVPNNSTAAAPTAEPTRSNHTFAGWYTAATGGVLFDFSTLITMNTVIHARWTPIELSPISHMVEFHPAAPNVIGRPNHRHVIHGYPIGALSTPSREGYTFLGWRLEYAVTGIDTIFTSSEVENMIITEPMVFFAQWRVIDNQGGGGSSDIGSGNNVSGGTGVNRVSPDPGPYRGHLPGRIVPPAMQITVEPQAEVSQVSQPIVFGTEAAAIGTETAEVSDVPVEVAGYAADYEPVVQPVAVYTAEGIEARVNPQTDDNTAVTGLVVSAIGLLISAATIFFTRRKLAGVKNV